MRKLFLLALSVALAACSPSGADRAPHGPGGPKGMIVVVLCGFALGFLFSIALSGLGIIPKVNSMPISY